MDLRVAVSYSMLIAARRKPGPGSLAHLFRARPSIRINPMRRLSAPGESACGMRGEGGGGEREGGCN